MNHFISRDVNKRKLYAKYEFKQKRLKIQLAKSTLPRDLLYHFFFQLSQLPHNTFRNRINNRCIITGRSKSVYKKYKLSRLMLRHLISIEGGIIGVIKDSW